jgi:hypothetical protein
LQVNILSVTEFYPSPSFIEVPEFLPEPDHARLFFFLDTHH